MNETMLPTMIARTARISLVLSSRMCSMRGMRPSGFSGRPRCLAPVVEGTASEGAGEPGYSELGALVGARLARRRRHLVGVAGDLEGCFLLLLFVVVAER